MTRSQLLFVILLNALVSLAVALAVVWIIDSRRPDPEELAALYTLQPTNLAVLAPTQSSAPPGEQPAQTTPSTAEQPAAPTDTPPPPGQIIEHVVQSGDSLAVIASKYKVTQDAIIKANNIADPNLLYVGVKLIIPVGGDGVVPAVVPTVQSQTGEGLRISVSAVGDLANEAVELINESDQPYALQGWRIQKEGGPEYTFSDVQVYAGSSVRLLSGAGTDDTIKRYWNQPAAVWQSGAVVKLLNNQGSVVTTFTVP